MICNKQWLKWFNSEDSDGISAIAALWHFSTCVLSIFGESSHRAHVTQPLHIVLVQPFYTDFRDKMSSAPPPHRRQSASRGPPMLPPGMPVRADHAKQTIVNNNNNNNTNNHKAPSAHMNMPMPHSHSQQRFAGSMPPPGPSPKTTASGAPRAQRAHPSPARPSPNPSSHHSADSLRESTRVNIRPSPRQPSSTLAWDETKSPQEPWLVTPKEQHSSQVKVRDEVDLQFDQLLVSTGHWPRQLTSGKPANRRLCSSKVQHGVARCQILHSPLLQRFQPCHPFLPRPPITGWQRKPAPEKADLYASTSESQVVFQSR